ncbi:MAG TPA: hypothetical protein DDZ96_12210 [Porphyromonadaceae bacterium]|jgi:hypothetical protein|nr:hypothetical protein [Porphyromonadaceae bacterium]HBX21376.1 hypothetical protein [Porphyromonadaceae bacterium]HCM21407.1 hypothetical protein [Porphyromonadaceae bacterium]
MEEKNLNEKESLELISRMIRNTQQKLEKGNGAPFLIWGYTTICVSLIVWYLFSATGDPRWNYLWFLILIIGAPVTFLWNRKQVKGVKTYIDKVIGYIWLAFGISGVIVSSVAIFFYWPLPILFIIVLLMGTGVVITGLVIRFKPIVFAGLGGILLSTLCLFVKGVDSILIFAAIFLVMMVIPGHILYYKGRKQ